MRLVFVSSTFKDMQFERDQLKIRVAPRIDAFLSQYGEDVHFSDLRWGINTSELDNDESSKKVLKVCLDEIDDCRPYMIVFIGERYGWIPSSELLKDAMKMKGITNVPDDISVTNLEIEYGALLNPDFEGRILFYFRNPLDTSKMSEEEKKIYESESPLHKEKLELLKKRILEKYPNYVRYYDAQYDEIIHHLTGLEPLMDQINSDLERIFKIDFDKYEALPNNRRAVINSETYFNRFSSNAYNRRNTEVYDFTESNDEYYTSRFDKYPAFELITGEEGSGRKTILALKYKNALKDNKKKYVSIPFACKLDKFTEGVKELDEVIIDSIEQYLGIDNCDDLSLERMVYLFKELEKKKSVFRFFIMNGDNLILDHIKTIEYYYPECRCVSFYLEMDKYEGQSLPYYHHNHLLNVEPLTKEERLGVINAIASSKHKELPNEVTQKILNKKDSFNPLYLSLITERLTMLDSSDFEEIRKHGDGINAINEYLQSIVEKSGNSIKDIAKDLLREIAQRVNYEMIIKVIAILTNEYVLNQMTIEAVFKYHNWPFNELDFSLFKRSIPSLFTNLSLSGEVIWYKNKDVLEGARELIEEVGEGNHAQDIIEFLENEKDIPEENRNQSLCYFYSLTGNYQKFVDRLIYYSEAQENNAVDSLNYNAMFAFMQPLIMSYLNDETFAMNVCDEIISRLVNNRVNYIYALANTYLTYFIQQSTISSGKEKELLLHHHVKVGTQFLKKYQQNPNNIGLFHFTILIAILYPAMSRNTRAAYSEENEDAVILSQFPQQNGGQDYINQIMAQGLISSFYNLAINISLIASFNMINQEGLDDDPDIQEYRDSFNSQFFSVCEQTMNLQYETFPAQIAFFEESATDLLFGDEDYMGVSIYVIYLMMYEYYILEDSSLNPSYVFKNEAIASFIVAAVDNIFDNEHLKTSSTWFVVFAEMYHLYLSKIGEISESSFKAACAIVDRLKFVASINPLATDIMKILIKYFLDISAIETYKNGVKDFTYSYDYALTITKRDMDFNFIDEYLIHYFPLFKDAFTNQKEMDDELLNLLDTYLVSKIPQLLIDDNMDEDKDDNLIDYFSYLLLGYLSILGRDLLLDDIIVTAIENVLLKHLIKKNLSTDYAMERYISLYDYYFNNN